MPCVFVMPFTFVVPSASVVSGDSLVPSAFMVFYSLVPSDFVMASGCVVSRAKIFDFLGKSSFRNKINLAATSTF